MQKRLFLLFCLAVFGCSALLKTQHHTPVLPDECRIQPESAIFHEDSMMDLLAGTCRRTPDQLNHVQYNAIHQLVHFSSSVHHGYFLNPPEKGFEQAADFYMDGIARELPQAADFLQKLSNAHVPLLRIVNCNVTAMRILLANNIPIVTVTDNQIQTDKCDYSFTFTDVIYGYKWTADPEDSTQATATGSVLFYFVSGFHGTCHSAETFGYTPLTYEVPGYPPGTMKALKASFAVTPYPAEKLSRILKDQLRHLDPCSPIPKFRKPIAQRRPGQQS